MPKSLRDAGSIQKKSKKIRLNKKRGKILESKSKKENQRPTSKD